MKILEKIMGRNPKKALDQVPEKVSRTLVLPLIDQGSGGPGLAFSAIPPSLYVLAVYEDSNQVYQELSLSLEPCDWYKFEKQPFYPQLIEWVRSSGNADTLRSIALLHERRD